MKNSLNKYLLFLIIVFFASCSKEKETVLQSDGTLTICTFNLEWLGDGIRDRNERTENDYKNIADIIKKTGADLFALQEIENSSALSRIIRYLPDYSFYVGKGGGQQNVAILFKKNMSVRLIGEYYPLEVEYRKTRPGLLAYIKKDNFDFYFMAVHLKSSSHWDNTEEKQENSREVRSEQCRILSFWADSTLKSGRDKDLIIAGDFNDTPFRKKDNVMEPLIQNHNLNFLTASIKSCKFRSMYVIDQIIATVSATNRLIKSSEHSYNFRDALNKDQAEKISDHCPVLVKFNSALIDND